MEKAPDVEPYPDLIWVWNGFWDLSKSRPKIAMAGPDFILHSEILAYSLIQEWGFEKIRQFKFFVDAMDMEFMAFCNEETKKEREKQETQKNQPRPPPRR